MEKKIFSGLVLCASMLIMGGNSVYALDNSPEWSGISFDFTNPGARARGIGGAFVAVADDASAMVTNPAGLNNLERPQIVVEGKYVDTSRDDSFIHDYWYDTTIDRDDTSFANLTYLSLSTPIFNKQFSMGLFYNETMHSENELDISYDFTQGAIPPLTTYSVDTTLDVNEFGLAFAGSALDGKLKIGASVSKMDLNIDSTFLAIELDDLSLRPYDLRNVGDDNFAFGLGVLVQLNEMFTIGANANIRPSFDVKTQISQSYWDDTFNNGEAAFGDPDGNSFSHGQYYDPETFARCTPGPTGSSYTCDSEFSMPDTYSIGVSFRPNDHWLFSVEGKYVKYSELKDDFIAPFWYYISATPGQFEIDDVWELHGGMEYLAFIKERPLAFRLGLYQDPAHEFQYTGADPATQGFFDGGDDQMHVTAGIGTLLSDSLQLDLALDYSDEVSQVVASAGYRF